ncbi:hypothetical protein PoMZ_10316 [Pyricularia oryzae]|uniref:Uncharacterized protein n=1 Tax=Pyricularia oryzae TaxID=318829 RepID=A0A4P7MZL2_PYROR|nr:hypothetical protein PoMZ_10316 [Pyricularia oryzae]
MAGCCDSAGTSHESSLWGCRGLRGWADDDGAAAAAVAGACCWWNWPRPSSPPAALTFTISVFMAAEEKIRVLWRDKWKQEENLAVHNRRYALQSHGISLFDNRRLQSTCRIPADGETGKVRVCKTEMLLEAS